MKYPFLFFFFSSPNSSLEHTQEEQEQEEEERQRWNSRVQFFLATIGFAVGIGNVWRFVVYYFDAILYKIIQFTKKKKKKSYFLVIAENKNSFSHHHHHHHQVPLFVLQKWRRSIFNPIFHHFDRFGSSLVYFRTLFG